MKAIMKMVKMGAALGILGSMSAPNYMRAPSRRGEEPRIYTKSRSNGRRFRRTGKKYNHGGKGGSVHMIKGNRQVINHRP